MGGPALKRLAMAVLPSTLLLLLLLHPPLAATTAAAAAATSRQAYFIFFEPMLRGPDWPHAFAKYRGGAVILDPFNVTAATVAAIRAELNASVLMYWDFGDLRSMQWADGVDGLLAPIPDGMGDQPCTGLTCCDHIRCSSRVKGSGGYKCGDDAYNRELRQHLNSSWVISRLLSNSSRAPICTDESGPLYIPSDASASAIVAWLARKHGEFKLDGLYLDGRSTTYSFSQGWPLAVNKTGWQFDIDGNGTPDSYSDMVGQFTAFAPLVTTKLRVALGPSTVIVANAGAGLSDPMLSGITVEIEGCVQSKSACENGLMAQQEVALAAQAMMPSSKVAPPLLSILWLTHSELMPAAEQCKHARAWQKQMPWLMIGTDFYDGSFVVCPPSSDNDSSIELPLKTDDAPPRAWYFRPTSSAHARRASVPTRIYRKNELKTMFLPVRH
eukprot:SAG22_NODE_1036_length_5904_cov_4.908355_6_plen_441_part_00